MGLRLIMRLSCFLFLAIVVKAKRKHKHKHPHRGSNQSNSAWQIQKQKDYFYSKRKQPFSLTYFYMCLYVNQVLYCRTIANFYICLRNSDFISKLARYYWTSRNKYKYLLVWGETMKAKKKKTKTDFQK